MTDSGPPQLPPEIVAHYSAGVEQPRLDGGTSRLEFARTQLILQRVLSPPPPASWTSEEGPAPTRAG